MMRQVTLASLIRNSWQWEPIEGMGLEWGIPSVSPRCDRRSSCPASNLAPGEKGGVFISPSNQTSDLSAGDITTLYVISDMSSICLRWENTRVSLGLGRRVESERGLGKRLCSWLVIVVGRSDVRVLPRDKGKRIRDESAKTVLVLGTTAVFVIHCRILPRTIEG